MKRYALIIVGLVIGGIVLAFPMLAETLEYNQEALNAPVHVPEPETPEYPDEWLEEAEKAKMDVLKRLEMETRSSELADQIETLSEEKEAIDKELGSY